MGRAVGYEPRFDRDLERGNVGEDLLELFFADGEDNNMFEVKTDYRINETGNIYVETHKYRKPDQSDLVPSGINVTEAKWWVFYDDHKFMWITPRQIIKCIFDNKLQHVEFTGRGDTKPKKAFLIKKDMLYYYGQGESIDANFNHRH